MVPPMLLVRSRLLAVGLSIPGVLPPCCSRFGGWMYRVGRKEEAGDEEDGVQGIEGEIG